MNAYDMTIHRNPDADAWAKFFIKTNPESPYDLDTMRAWFANAMMAMHDYLVLGSSPINGDHAAFLMGEKE